MNQETHFELLLKLKELEREIDFKIEQDKDNKNLFYLIEPNATIPFATLDYNKESENARANSKTSTLRECSDIFIERIRGINRKRIARSKEREDRSRAESRESRAESRRSGAEISRDNEIGRKDRQLHQFYDSQIWQQVSPQERIKAEELSKEFEEQYRQSELYKQKVLKAYQQNQQNGVTFTPKNPQSEITSNTESPQAISPPDYEAILNADKGFRTEKTIQYTIEQISKEYHLPLEQVKREVDRQLQNIFIR